MSVLLVAHLTATAAYAGFQWTVQLLVYRQFDLVPADAFTAYELAHRRRVSVVVGPLFAAMLATTVGLIAVRPEGTPWWAAGSAAVLLAVVLVATALSAVPLHNELSRRWNPAVHASLLRTDAIRTSAATINVALAVHLVLRADG